MVKWLPAAACIALFLTSACSGSSAALMLDRVMARLGGVGSRDVVADQSGTRPFAAETYVSIPFEITLLDREGKPVERALFRVISEDRGEIARALSDASGRLEFPCLLRADDEVLTMVMEHPTCAARVAALRNPREILGVSRVFTMDRLDGGASVVTDRDGDGIADVIDQFPDDPRLAAAVERSFTLAFNGSFPARGDADFHDLIVSLTMRELITPGNLVSGVSIRSTVLAAGSDTLDPLWIGIAGREYLLVDDPRIDLEVPHADEGRSPASTGPGRELVILPENPLPRMVLGAMPYDPYIKQGGADDKQVHLAFVMTSWTGPRIGDDRLPGALLLPSGWEWPVEGTAVENAYPGMRTWLLAGGTESSDWYHHPADGAVVRQYPRAAKIFAAVRAMPGLALDRSLACGGIVLFVTFVVCAIRRPKEWAKRP